MSVVLRFCVILQEEPPQCSDLFFPFLALLHFPFPTTVLFPELTVSFLLHSFGSLLRSKFADIGWLLRKYLRHTHFHSSGIILCKSITSASQCHFFPLLLWAIRNTTQYNSKKDPVFTASASETEKEKTYLFLVLFHFSFGRFAFLTCLHQLEKTQPHVHFSLRLYTLPRRKREDFCQHMKDFHDNT